MPPLLAAQSFHFGLRLCQSLFCRSQLASHHIRFHLLGKELVLGLMQVVKGLI